jgi:hypothetical protein
MRANFINGEQIHLLRICAYVKVPVVAAYFRCRAMNGLVGLD